MFPKMGTSIDMVIQRMEGDKKWNGTDLTEETVNKVIAGLREQRALTTNQVTYIKGIVSRARSFMKSLVHFLLVMIRWHHHKLW